MFNFTAVTVTYSNRWSLLAEVLHAAKREGAKMAIVVDNGSTYDVRAKSSDEFGDWCKVISLGRNNGSAAGFRRGIEAAGELGANFVLLLDDDNVVTAGSVSLLHQAWLAERKDGNKRLAVFAYRKHHGGHIVDDVSPVGYANSCLGFHVVAVAYKIRRRLGLVRATIRSIQGPLPAENAPYGGLFFHIELVDIIGLPDVRFVLYQDDTEYTMRICRSGTLKIVPTAEIRDIDQSWSEASKKNLTSFENWLVGEPEFRIYYTMRNMCYIDWNLRRSNLLVFFINCLAYFLILSMYAVYLGRFSRLRTLISAAASGWSGNLGENSRFPLPQSKGTRACNRQK